MYSIAAGDCFTEGGRGSDRIADGSTSVLFSASAYGKGMTASISLLVKYPIGYLFCCTLACK